MEPNHNDIFSLVYLVATLLFIFGLKGLSSPKTALRGNMFAMVGMFIACAATLLNPEVHSYTWILAGLAAGAALWVIGGKPRSEHISSGCPPIADLDRDPPSKAIGNA